MTGGIGQRRSARGLKTDGQIVNGHAVVRTGIVRVIPAEKDFLPRLNHHARQSDVGKNDAVRRDRCLRARRAEPLVFGLLKSSAEKGVQVCTLAASEFVSQAPT